MSFCPRIACGQNDKLYQEHVPLPHVFPPFAIRQSPTGRATLGSRTLSDVASLCHSLRWCKKKQSAPATSYSRLVLGTRYGRRRCSSNSVFEQVSACILTPQNCQVKLNKWQFSERKCALNCGFCVLGLCQSIYNYSEDNKHGDENCGDDWQCFVTDVLD